VCVTFDGNGRPWVCEMRSYMPDIDGTGEDGRLGRISILEDTDGDGQADEAKVFLDNLLLPRALQFVDGGVLWADNEKLYFTERKGDEAGETTVVDPDWAPSGNVEHKPNGLLYGMDNWLYNAKSDSRYRKVDGEWVKEKVQFRGQWGISQDDFGRLVTNSNSNLLAMESVPPGYVKRNPNHSFQTNTVAKVDNKVYPIRITCGINRGYMDGMLDERGFLKKPTGSCGMTIYRGDNFPPEYRGNAFIPEPCGLLLKRAILSEVDGLISARPAYEGREFLGSMDERNRFVNSYTAPDGTLYLVDLYHGIIQHKTYVTSYLRNQLVERGLDQNNNDRGRIYRVRWSGKPRSNVPAMEGKPGSELVAFLDHANGWCRDTAQRLIVQSGDESALPALRASLKTATPKGQMHALWTLNGLNQLSIADLETVASVREPKVLATIARVSESFANTENEAAAAKVLGSIASRSPGLEVDRYLAASLASFPSSGQAVSLQLLADILMRHNRDGDKLIRDMAMSGLSGSEMDFAKIALRDNLEITTDLVRAIVNSGKTDQTNQLVSLVTQNSIDSSRQDKLLKEIARTAVSKRSTGITTELLALAAEESRRSPIVDGMISGGKSRGFKQIAMNSALPEFLTDVESSKNKKYISVVKLFDTSGRSEKNYIKTAEHKRLYALGKTEYAKLCIACHQPNGQGIAPLAPPLVDSEWVTGPERRLIAITMEGMMGPVTVNGTLYQAPDIQPVMPGIRVNPELDDEELAGILTYVRNTWGNHAPPVSPETVAKWRKEQGPRAPYTEEEARKIK
ncbi:MAG: c-type cytochrome, partial [Verrucomicrobiota bacterium]